VGKERLALELERRSGAARLVMHGRLDMATCPLLQGVLEALRIERSPVVLDLEDVNYIDGAGVQLLLNTEAEALRDGWAMEVVGITESLRAAAGDAAPGSPHHWPGWRAGD
jgi:anti-anti-sigma factor